MDEDRVAGHPFFCEALVRTMQEGGVVSVLCEDVIGLNIQYLEPLNDTWLDAWDSSQPSSPYTYNRLPLQVRVDLTLRGLEADKPIRLHTKVSLGIQTPLSFGIPKQQLSQIISQQGRM